MPPTIHPLEQTLSVVGPVVGAIVFLTLFFKAIAWIGQRSEGEGTPNKFRGVVGKDVRVTVHLGNRDAFENVLLVGFIDTSTGKAAIPYQWGTMVILECLDRRRFLIPAKQVRMIEVPRPPNNAHPQASAAPNLP